MSRTRRRVPPFMKDCSPEFKTKVSRGHVGLDMVDDRNDVVVWTPPGKRFMKKTKTRAARRILKKMGVEYTNLRLSKTVEPEDMLGLPQVASLLE